MIKATPPRADYIAVNMRQMRRIVMELERIKVQVSAALAAYYACIQQDILTPKVESNASQNKQNIPSTQDVQRSPRVSLQGVESIAIQDKPVTDASAIDANHPDCGGNPGVNQNATRPKAGSGPKKG